MRLLEYNQKLANEYTEIINAIYRDCRPFIKELTKGKHNGDLLYSGRRKGGDIIKSTVRNNRTPMDTPLKYHRMLDKLFKKEVGFNARSNAIFCTGSVSQALDYSSKVYIIFPIGQYKYAWSPEIKDLYDQLFEDFDGDWILKLGEGEDMYDEDDFDDRVDYRLRKMYDKYVDELTDLDKEDEIPDEDEYVDEHWDKVAEEIAIEMVKEAKDYNDKLLKAVVDTYKTTNLKDALASGHEIMLNCKEYYGFNRDKYENIISSVLYLTGSKKPTQSQLESILSNIL